jgi:BRCA1-associated protein
MVGCLVDTAGRYSYDPVRRGTLPSCILLCSRLSVRSHCERSDASPNRTIVLLKFEQTKAAEDFISIYTGKAFSASPERAETCHPVQIYHLLLHDTTSSASSSTLTLSTQQTRDTQKQRRDTTSRPVPLLAKLLKGIPQRTVYELPTCPVCLERMDSVVTGLITTPCTHIFNCSCLSKWGNGNAKGGSGGWCPVCRLSHQRLLAPPPLPVSTGRSRTTKTANSRSPIGRQRSLSSSTGTQETADEPKCMQCQAMDSSEDDSPHPHPSQVTSADTATGTIVPAGTLEAPDDGSPRSNWICVICGYLGCSRYARGHARDHYARTGHAYSMEIDTQRVWDYVEDR